jgi:carbon starvation protein
MSLPLLALLVLAALALGYTVYGRFVARQYALDDARPTPAERLEDGVDFVPTRPFYLMGQHFSAIAAAGPIAGPILACQSFGWAPCVVWITLGVVFIGAVHDLSALVASIRHGARSIAEIVKENLGRRAWLAILAFIWIALVYVIMAFADITAANFIGETEVTGDGSFNKGGAVAAASTLYLLLALAMGVVQRAWSPPLLAMTLVFVPATLGVVWLGTQVSTVLILPHATWAALIMGYCFVASLIPVWTLLQPRGYLGGFVLYLALAVGVLGVFFGGFEIEQPAFTSAPLAGLEGNPLFPFLFVTIACGACSGFHGLVCSGTTSKQIARETHCRAVGYGAMLLEGFVAVIALATIMIVAPPAKGSALASPGVIYGDGIARFLTGIVGEEHLAFARTLGSMAFATFVFDTLDVATRLGRYILEELTGTRGRRAALVATAVTAGLPLVVLLATGKDGYRTFWSLFGTSNQLLAGLTLLGISVWLKRSGRRCWFTVAPMLFVMTITIWSLAAQAWTYLGGLADPATGALRPAALANGIVAVVFAALAAFLVSEAARALRRPATA